MVAEDRCLPEAVAQSVVRVGDIGSIRLIPSSHLPSGQCLLQQGDDVMFRIEVFDEHGFVFPAVEQYAFMPLQAHVDDPSIVAVQPVANYPDRFRAVALSLGIARITFSAITRSNYTISSPPMSVCISS